MASWDDDEFESPDFGSAASEVIDAPTKAQSVAIEDDEFLEARKPLPPAPAPAPVIEDTRPPMMLVDMTALSDNKIHNRFDKHGVNDIDAKQALSATINADYVKYRDDAALIARGVVRTCAQSVWREALAALRDEHEGHYWAPIFPPK